MRGGVIDRNCVLVNEFRNAQTGSFSVIVRKPSTLLGVRDSV